MQGWDVCTQMRVLEAHDRNGGPSGRHVSASVSAPGGAETRAALVHRRLEAEIAEGRIEPGTRLDEQEVAERFGVSRTPVREAFRLLAAEDLVELRGRPACSPAPHRRATAVPGRHPRPAGRCCRPRGTDVFYDVNQEFHEAIYAASSNAFRADQTRRLRNRVAAYRRRVTRMPTRIADTLQEHQEILDAIFAHDGERAHAAMRAHLSLLGDNLLDFIAAFD